MFVLWFVQMAFSLVSAVATYLPLWATYRGWNVWVLAWQIWAIIGFTIFWISMSSVILRLYLEIRGFKNEDYKRRKCKEELEIQELKYKALQQQNSQML